MAFSPFVCRGKAVLTVPQNERRIYAPAWTKIENTSPQFQNIMKGYCKWFLQLAVKFATHNVLLRAKKVGHQISVSFEKFDVVQALLSFF
jgi:hypothetical protein